LIKNSSKYTPDNFTSLGQKSELIQKLDADVENYIGDLQDLCNEYDLEEAESLVLN